MKLVSDSYVPLSAHAFADNMASAMQSTTELIIEAKRFIMVILIYTVELAY